MPDEETRIAQEERAARLQAAIDELDKPPSDTDVALEKRQTIREWVEQRGEQLRHKTDEACDTPPDNGPKP